MVRQLAAALVFVASLAWPVVSGAESPSPWTVRIGYANATFDTSSSLSLAGTPAPDASIRIADQRLVLGDLGRDLTDHWTVRVAFGVPVEVPILAGGSLKGLSPPLTGVLGEITIAPVIASMLYYPGTFGAFRPYVGAGANYTRVLKTQDGDVVSLQASSGWGAVLQAGCDVVLNRHWSAFVDARKIIVETRAWGTLPALGDLPVEASVTLDPLIVSAGFGYRF